MKQRLRKIANGAWLLTSETLTRWNRNDGSTLAASMAYYAALSFFPLLLVLISALGFTLRFSVGAESARDALIDMVERTTAPALADSVETILSEVRTNASLGGPFGLITLLFGAIGIFAQLDAAFGRIWHDATPRVHGAGRVVIDVLTNRLKAFLVLLGLGLLVVVLFFVGMALSIVRDWATAHRLWLREWDQLQTPATVVINALVFSTLYKVLPRPSIRWLHALAGGIVAASIWEIGRQLLAYVVAKANYSTYGVIGAFLAMMVWVYYASTLLFLGAQFVQVLGHRHDDDLTDSSASDAPAAAGAE